MTVDLGSELTEGSEDITVTAEHEGYVTMPFVDVPGSGNHTFSLQITKPIGSLFNSFLEVSNRSLLAIETKR